MCSSDLGLVGDPTPGAPSAVVDALAAGRIPVVAPLARGADGQALNVNADEAAAALAVGLGAERILFVSDVLPGNPASVAAGSREVLTATRRWGVTPARVAGGHGAVMEWAEVERAGGE